MRSHQKEIVTIFMDDSTPCCTSLKYICQCRPNIVWAAKNRWYSQVYCEIFDKLFDCMNIRYNQECMTKQKCFLMMSGLIYVAYGYIFINILKLGRFPVK